MTDQLTCEALASLHYPSFSYILLKIIFTTGFTCPTYCIKLLCSSMSLSSRFLSQIENVQRQFINQWSVLVCYFPTTTFQFSRYWKVLTKFWMWTCNCLRLAHNTAMPDQPERLTYGLDSDIPSDHRWRHSLLVMFYFY